MEMEVQQGELHTNIIYKQPRIDSAMWSQTSAETYPPLPLPPSLAQRLTLKDFKEMTSVSWH